jgi:hypothetical protein
MVCLEYLTESEDLTELGCLGVIAGSFEQLRRPRHWSFWHNDVSLSVPILHVLSNPD